MNLTQYSGYYGTRNNNIFHSAQIDLQIHGLVAVNWFPTGVQWEMLRDFKLGGEQCIS